MHPIRVILVDDHAIIRDGLRMIIENDAEVEVVGEASSIKDALDLVASEKPDIILLDLDLGKESSLDFMQEIYDAAENTQILILTGVIDEIKHKRAMQNGARGILLKNQSGTILLKAIKKVHQGEAWVDRTLTAKLLAEKNNCNTLNKETQMKIDSLTKREYEIVELISEGLVNKEIAERLFVGEKTIRNCLTVIYSKLEVSNRLELAIFASRNELIK